MSDILSRKRDLRRAMEEKRRQLAVQHPDAAIKLRDHFLKTISLPERGAVSLYHAQNSEMNPALLAIALHGLGHTLALPVITARGQPLLFRTYEIGDKLIEGPMGILEPSLESPSVEPDILLVPLLAFDKRGYRIGYGAGYYDRTLTDLRQRRKILAIGLGYAGQEVPEVPVESHDAKLDKIATETKLFKYFAP